MSLKNQFVTQAVVVGQDEIDSGQITEKIAFFTSDGVPINVGPSAPVNLADHIADPTPHDAAMSGLDLAAVYAAGRI